MINLTEIFVQIAISLILYRIGGKIFQNQKDSEDVKCEQKRTVSLVDKNEEIIQQLTLDIKMNNQIGLDYFNHLVAELKGTHNLELYKQLVICTEGMGNISEQEKIFAQMGAASKTREFFSFRIRNINHNLYQDVTYDRIDQILVQMTQECNLEIDDEIASVVISKLSKLSDTKQLLNYFINYHQKGYFIQMKASKNMIYCLRNNFMLVTSYKKFKEMVEMQFDKIMCFIDHCFYNFYQKENVKHFNLLQLYLCMMDLGLKFQNSYLFNQCDQDMKKKDICMKDNLPYQLILIKKYSTLNQLDKCLTIYQELKDNNVEINQQILGSLVQACVQNEKLDKGLKLIEEQKDKKQISTIIYTTIINAYTKKKCLEKAEKLIELMKTNANTFPNIVTYNSYMNCCIRCNNYEKLTNTYKQIESGEIRNVKPDFITYSTYIRGMFKSKKEEMVKKAIKLYEFLKADYMSEFDDVFYSSLLDGLIMNDQLEYAEKVIQEMKSINYQFSVINYSIIMKLFLKQKKYQESLDILYHINKMNKDYSLNKYQTTSRIFQNQQKSITNIFYYTLINGFHQNDQLKLNIKVLFESFENKIILKNEVYRKVSFKIIKMLNQLKKKKQTDKTSKKESDKINQKLAFYKKAMIQIANYINENQIEISKDLYQKIGKSICSV